MHPLPSEGAIGEREQDNHCPGPLADRNLQEYDGKGVKDARNIFHPLIPPTSHHRIFGFSKLIRKQPCTGFAIPRTTITAAQHLSTHIDSQGFHHCKGHKICSKVTATQTSGKPRRLNPSRSKRNRCTQPAKESSEQRPINRHETNFLCLVDLRCFGNCPLQADHRIPFRPPRLRFPLTLGIW